MDLLKLQWEARRVQVAMNKNIEEMQNLSVERYDIICELRDIYKYSFREIADLLPLSRTSVETIYKQGWNAHSCQVTR